MEVNAEVMTSIFLAHQHDCVTPCDLTRINSAHFQYLLHVCLDLIHHGWGNPSELLLKGFIITTLILCVARSVQSSSPGSNKKMSWYSANKVWAVMCFALDHPSRQDRSVAGGAFLFLFNQHLSLLDTLHLIYLLQSSGCQVNRGHSIHSYYLCDFNALGDSDQNGCQVFHYYCNSFAPWNHFSVCVHHTQAMRQMGSITSSQNLGHYIHVVSEEHGFHLAMYYLEEKVPTSSLFVVLSASFKSVWSTAWCKTASPLSKSSAQWHANNWAILNPSREANNSLKSHSLITVMILIDSGCTQSNQYSRSKNDKAWYN